MASVNCKLCDKEFAIIACNDCKMLVCGKCSSVCRGCGVSVCDKHTQQTKAGTKMCGPCMAEREARRQALQEKYGKPSEAKKAKSSSLNINVGGIQSTSLEDLTGGEQLIPPTETPEFVESEADVAVIEDYLDETLKPEDDRIPSQEREKASFTKTGRLELPQMDQNRPVLGLSGYSPPAKVITLLVMIFTGITMIYAYKAIPALESTLFPFEKTEIKFEKNLRPIATETNALRNTSNIQPLDGIAQIFTFAIAWGVVIVYLGFLFMLLYAVVHVLIFSRTLKQQQEAIKGLEKSSKDLYL